MKYTDKEIFINALKLIKDESGWTQGQYAVNDAGNAVPIQSNKACRFCSSGAIMNVADGIIHTMMDNINSYCHEQYGKWLADYNDNHTHSEVITMWVEFGKSKGYLPQGDFTID